MSNKIYISNAYFTTGDTTSNAFITGIFSTKEKANSINSKYEEFYVGSDKKLIIRLDEVCIGDYTPLKYI